MSISPRSHDVRYRRGAPRHDIRAEEMPQIVGKNGGLSKGRKLLMIRVASC